MVFLKKLMPGLNTWVYQTTSVWHSLLCLKLCSSFSSYITVIMNHLPIPVWYNSMLYHSVVWLLFSPHRITLASSKVRRLSRVFLRGLHSSATLYLRVINLNWHNHLVTNTHCKAAVHHFREIKAFRLEFPKNPGLESSIMQSQLNTSLYLGIISLFSDLSPSTPPNPFEVKASVIFGQV